MKTTLVIADRAYAAIVRECLAYPCVETGGILVGQRTGRSIVAPFVVNAGPRARRSLGGFEPDSDFQQGYLDYLYTRFSLNYVGDWHRHPGRFDRPSAQDHRTARAIVFDPDWSTPEAVFPIATIVDGAIRVRAYLMRRIAAGFEEIAIEVVPDVDRRIRSVLLRDGRLRGRRIDEETEGAAGHCREARPPRRHRDVPGWLERLWPGSTR